MALKAMTLALAALALTVAQGAARAGEERQVSYGEAEYYNSCASCHGLEGKGDGALAENLRTAPTDLTLLSQQNGGAFPFWRVYAVIDGRHVVPGHGERDMPVWGRQFLDFDVEEFGPKGGEIITSGRIEQLARYIESLQR
jgi:mono/diheme cytochrome c family protein